LLVSKRSSMYNAFMVSLLWRKLYQFILGAIVGTIIVLVFTGNPQASTVSEYGSAYGFAWLAELTTGVSIFAFLGMLYRKSSRNSVGDGLLVGGSVVAMYPVLVFTFFGRPGIVLTVLVAILLGALLARLISNAALWKLKQSRLLLRVAGPALVLVGVAGMWVVEDLNLGLNQAKPDS
jgi:hypothetical protein